MESNTQEKKKSFKIKEGLYKLTVIEFMVLEYKKKVVFEVEMIKKMKFPVKVYHWIDMPKSGAKYESYFESKILDFVEACGLPRSMEYLNENELVGKSVPAVLYNKKVDEQEDKSYITVRCFINPKTIENVMRGLSISESHEQKQKEFPIEEMSATLTDDELPF